MNENTKLIREPVVLSTPVNVIQMRVQAALLLRAQLTSMFNFRITFT